MIRSKTSKGAALATKGFFISAFLAAFLAALLAAPLAAAKDDDPKKKKKFVYKLLPIECSDLPDMEIGEPTLGNMHGSSAGDASQQQTPQGSQSLGTCKDDGMRVVSTCLQTGGSVIKAPNGKAYCWSNSTTQSSPVTAIARDGCLKGGNSLTAQDGKAICIASEAICAR